VYTNLKPRIIMATNKRKPSKEKIQASSTKKKTATKKSKQKQMQFADGRDDRQNIAKTVEALMSVNTQDPFRLPSGENFEEAVSSLTLSQLQEIAVKAGVFPSGTKATLRNKLLKEYDNRHEGRYGSSTSSRPIADPNSQKAKDILRIINE
jgi:hypothetical protein